MLSINSDAVTLWVRSLVRAAVSVAIVVLSSVLLFSLPLSLNVDWIERSCYLQIPLKTLLNESEIWGVTPSTPIYLEDKNLVSIK